MCQRDFNGRFKYRESLYQTRAWSLDDFDTVTSICHLCFNACDGRESIILISIRGLQAYL